MTKQKAIYDAMVLAEYNKENYRVFYIQRRTFKNWGYLPAYQTDNGFIIDPDAQKRANNRALTRFNARHKIN